MITYEQAKKLRVFIMKAIKEENKNKSAASPTCTPCTADIERIVNEYEKHKKEIQ